MHKIDLNFIKKIRLQIYLLKLDLDYLDFGIQIDK